MNAKKDWSIWRPATVPGVDVLRAHFFEHRFDRHSHDTWSFGVTHHGRQTFACRGQTLTSTPGHVIVFRPDDPHDGHAGDATGFNYSMIYVPPERVDACLRDAVGPPRGDFSRALWHDPTAARHIALLAEALLQTQESLRADTLLSQVIVGLFQRHAGLGTNERAASSGAAWLAAVRDHLESHFDTDVRVDELASLARVSRVHLTRAFARRFGVPPHVYLNNVRLRRARQFLLRGHGLAQAAASAGFADQSHLTRRFKGSFGLTPKAWLAAVSTR